MRNGAYFTEINLNDDQKSITITNTNKYPFFIRFFLFLRKSNRFKNKNQDNLNQMDQVDRIPEKVNVQTFDYFCFLFSIFTYLFDIIFDVIVACLHYSNQRVGFLFKYFYGVF